MSRFIRVIIYLISLLILYLYSTHMERNIMWEIHFGLTPFILILLIKECIAILPTFIFNIIAEIGKKSYIIFLIHGIIIENYKHLLYPHHFIVSAIILLVISYIISLLLTWLMQLIHYDKPFAKLQDYLLRKKNFNDVKFFR